jgi:dihydropyrimidinase
MLLIKNGSIVTADHQQRADICCEGETITRIGPDLPAPPGAEVVDAAGMYVFPGFIDPHTHIYLPLAGGLTSKDNYTTASQAAVIGGTTTIFDMCGPSRHEDPWTAYQTWQARAAGQSACDYSFHMTLSRFDADAERQIRRIVDDGIASFKVYLAYRGAFGLEDDELYAALRLARELGVITAAHCENAALIEQRQRDLLAAGKTGPQWHEPSRPPQVEAEGVHHLLTFAELTGAHAYIVHLSCEPALRIATAARHRGQPVWIETLVQYLLLDKTATELPGLDGARYVMSPPLREDGNQDVLWDALRDGDIDTVATDHAPFDLAQKSRGLNDFTKIPSGLPGIEDRINLLFTYGVRGDRFDLRRLVAVASANPAKIFGLYPRKGTIEVGSDADLVVYDPNYQGRISAETQHMNVDYNAYEGIAIAGRPHVVTVRGQVAARDGEFVGSTARGQLLRRKPTHHSV